MIPEKGIEPVSRAEDADDPLGRELEGLVAAGYPASAVLQAIEQQWPMVAAFLAVKHEDKLTDTQRILICRTFHDAGEEEAAKRLASRWFITKYLPWGRRPVNGERNGNGDGACHS